MINTKMPDFITNWDKTLEILREELNDTMFDTWIAPLVPKKMDNMSGTLYVEGENEYKIQRFNERYLQIANSAASIAFGHPVRIEASVAAAPPAVAAIISVLLSLVKIARWPMQLHLSSPRTLVRKTSIRSSYMAAAVLVKLI